MFIINDDFKEDSLATPYNYQFRRMGKLGGYSSLDYYYVSPRKAYLQKREEEMSQKEHQRETRKKNKQCNHEAKEKGKKELKEKIQRASRY